ncbi:MAG: GFA family protein [Bradyrhizobium sp.]|uniref:GFA family protein n=1 Tax=Bradyrhizobium sp. TaxID=376 RepID=UPI001DB33F66|nr:GFA family protein [Bradyrhizobium sp.]MBV9563970.1 GFA family protein [Bradyrhizobium sp.]
MKLEGGCYCGAVRYVAEGEPRMKAQCHCRECQYITGGAPNLFMAMPPDGFQYTKGAPRKFARSDLEKPVTREFCAECGTHLVTRPNFPIVVLKVGTLDDPKLFGAPQSAIYTCDQQPFHVIPEGLPSFERLPAR